MCVYIVVILSRCRLVPWTLKRAGWARQRTAVHRTLLAPSYVACVQFFLGARCLTYGVYAVLYLTEAQHAAEASAYERQPAVDEEKEHGQNVAAHLPPV